MTVTEIVNEIYSLQDMEDLKKVRTALQIRSDELATRTRAALEVGDEVTWTVKKGKNAGKYRGVIEKINRKNLVIRTETHRWQVHPNLLD